MSRTDVTLREALDGVSQLATGQTHVLRVAFPRVRLRFTQHSEPWADAPFTLEINGQTVVQDGKTDSDGWLDEQLDCLPKRGEVIVGSEQRTQSYELKFRDWQRASEEEALKCRLHNLGHRCADEPKEAIAEFQGVCGDEPKGEHDDGLCSRLEVEHGI